MKMVMIKPRNIVQLSRKGSRTPTNTETLKEKWQPLQMPDKPRIHVALGLGSNKGNPVENIRTAVRFLTAGGLHNACRSSLYETEPVGCEPGAPRFINAALTGDWHGTLTELLQLCKTIEQRLGRPAQHSSSEARTIDVDILLADDRQLAVAGLIIPHPRLRSRLFVLLPLSELVPDWIIPGITESVAEATAKLLRETTDASRWARRFTE
jgi:2-amino-4-hydroxy-6-hydroxymethyldihydropteridine diphosphokinase